MSFQIQDDYWKVFQKSTHIFFLIPVYYCFKWLFISNIMIRIGMTLLQLRLYIIKLFYNVTILYILNLPVSLGTLSMFMYRTWQIFEIMNISYKWLLIFRIERWKIRYVAHKYLIILLLFITFDPQEESCNMFNVYSTQISDYINVSYDFWSPGWMLKDVFNNRSQCEGGNTAPRLWVRCRLSLQPLVCDKCNHWSQVSVLK